MKNKVFLSLPSLFGEIEADTLRLLKSDSCVIKQQRERRDRKKSILNKDLLPKNIHTEGEYQLPIVEAYNGILPDECVAYNAKPTSKAKTQGIHCFTDDESFMSTYSMPLRALKKVSQFYVAMAPDHTLWVDGLICENIEQLRKNRVTTIYWQSNGVPTIQTASWGNADSLEYAFDGLAPNSITAIGNTRLGDSNEQKLREYAIKTLVKKKSPTILVVVGWKLGFDPGVPVVIYPAHIQKLRNLK